MIFCIRLAGWQNKIDKNIETNGVMPVSDTGIQSFFIKNVVVCFRQPGSHCQLLS
ncbi:MAG: hypothetical protein ACR5LA_02310 [Wolbachia sp.]